MEAFFATWKLIDNQNLDGYMKALGLEQEMIQIGNLVKPIVTIYKEGSIIVMKTQTTVSNVSISFRLNEEFDEITIDGRQCKSVISMKDNKLMHVQKWDSNETTLIREIKDGKMVLTITFQDVVCVRTYVKL